MRSRKSIFLSILIIFVLVFMLAGCDNGKKSTGTPLPNVPETYSLKIDIIGEGNVKKTPDKEVYEKNDMVTLKAIPEGGMFKLTTLKTGQVPGFKRNEANKLAFSLKDSVFTFYINGSYVDYIKLEDIIPVFFLILTSPDNDTTAYFDNLKLLSLDPQIEPINLDIVSQNKNLPEAMKIIDIRNE